MKKTLFIAGLIAANFAVTACDKNSTDKTEKETVSMIKAPIAKKTAHDMTIHGDTRTDYYYWMRDDERKDPEMLAHLNAEKAYTKSMLAHTESFQDKLFEELKSRIKKDNSSYPTKRRGFWYHSSFSGDAEYPVYLRKKDGSNKEETYLDANILAKGHEFFSLGGMSVSHDNNRLAYATDLLSRRVYTIEIKDIKSGELLKDKLEGTTGNMIWANDNQTIFYIKKDMQTLLGNKVYRHKLGTDQKDDVLVYEEKDPTFYMGLSKSRDDSTLFIWHDSTIKAGVSTLDANTPDGEFKLFHALEDHHEYSISKAGNDYYIRTNWKAKNFRLMKVAADKTADKKAWVDVIAHRDNVYFENYEVFNDKLVVSEKTRGQTEIRVIDFKSGKDFKLKFNDPLYSANISSNPNMDSDTVRISYSSMTTPRSLYDFSMNDGSSTLLKQTEVLGDFDPANYKSERIFIKARDGKEVPVSIVYRSDMFKKDGTNPIYQYAYGSYGATMNPSFSSSRLTLLNRGVVFVLAHIRGGQMLGRPWYEDGKLYNKMNSFTDFMDVTKAVTALKYGNKKTVFAAGGSAGGLLIGGVINMEPELYLGVLAAVPFVDVVTTMLDTSIPLTTNEYDEWGNPNEKGYYDYMMSYSPYDNVKKQDYPHIYVSSGLHDSQVQYFEPAKWVAKLRDYKTDHNKLVFDIDMEAGHGGASGRFKSYKDLARRYAFYFDLIGIEK